MIKSTKKKKIYVFTKYTDTGASSNFRIYIFKEKLDVKFDTFFYPFWDDKYYTKYMSNKKKYLGIIGLKYIFNIIQRKIQLRRALKDADILFIQKSLYPGLKVSDLQKFINKNVPIIYDVDDAVYLTKNDVSDKIAEQANLVIVGNNDLKEHYSKYNDNVQILPTVDYSPAYKDHVKDTFDNKIIGWIGSHSSVDNLEMLVEPLNKLVSKHPEVQFQFICDQDYGYVNRIKNAQFIKWEKSKYIQDMANFSIGVMPLFENEFNKGKCGFKLIQYLNLNIPIVASPLGVNTELARDYGFEAIDVNEWVLSMEKLLYNKEIYDEKKRLIESKFSIKYGYENVSSSLMELICSLVSQ